MNKYIKIYCTTILTLILIFTIGFQFPKAISNVNLVRDSSNKYTLPGHFRKSSDKVNIINNQNINLSGLSNLNISGSAQFSEKQLSLIINSINNDFNIIDIDLREESHGFINGIAVSWKNELNNANMGLSKEEVIKTENYQLNSISLNKPISFFNKKKTNCNC